MVTPITNNGCITRNHVEKNVFQNRMPFIKRKPHFNCPFHMVDFISLSTCKQEKSRVKQPRNKSTEPRQYIITVFPLQEISYTYPTQVSEEQANSLPHQNSLCLTNGTERNITSDVARSGRSRAHHVFHAQERPVPGPRTPRENFHFTGMYGPRRGGHAQNTTNHAANSDVRLLQPPKHPEYVSASNRLMSFWNWSEPGKPDKHHLTTAGFFYTGKRDMVRCFQCGIGLKDFDANDEPMLEHIKHSGDCPFLAELLGEEQHEAHKKNLRRNDPEFCRQRQLEDLRNRSEGASFNTEDAVRGQPIVYKNPNYATYNARVSSFSRFPRSVQQTPQDLAAAGLFYTGFQDLVRCCACDGGLKMWKPSDDPWFEHCRWFPACPFVRLIKGPEYIAQVQKMVEIQKQEKGAREKFPSFDNEVAGAVSKLTITEDDEKLQAKQCEIDAITRSNLIEMGFNEHAIKKAVEALKAKGKDLMDMTATEIIDQIYIGQNESTSISAPSEAEKRQKTRKSELLNENAILKSLTRCSDCDKNEVSVLFLPCQHHRLCFECGNKYAHCPHCHKQIKEKVRTYMS